jgi:DNA-binding XRE family transcriptional regulator
MDLGLTRKAAAKVIGTNEQSLKHWEDGSKTYIRPMFYPGIIAFLRYDPRPVAKTRGESIRRERLAKGWSLAKLAEEANVDPATIRRMEANTRRLGRRSLRSVCRVLGLDYIVRPLDQRRATSSDPR